MYSNLPADSVLSGLLSDYKKDTLRYNKKIKLIQCIKARIKILYGHNMAYYTALLHKVEQQYSALISAPNIFLRLEADAIEGVSKTLEQQCVSSIYKFNGYLQKIGAIEYYNSLLRSKERGIAKELLLTQTEISKFSSVLELYTNNTVKFKQISHTSSHFIRCQKVLQTSITANDFEGSIFGGLSLCSAFKIDNAVLLSRFDQLLQNDLKFSMKGLYYQCSQEVITVLGTLGFFNKFSTEQFRKHYLRIPISIFQSIPSTIETKLISTPPCRVPVYLSPNAVNDKVKELLSGMSEDNIGLVHLLLCRCIISDDPSIQLYYSDINRQYEAHSFESILPEYIFICKPILKGHASLYKPSQDTTKVELELDSSTQMEELDKIQKSIFNSYNNFWPNVSAAMRSIVHPMIIKLRRKVVDQYKESAKRIKQFLDELKKLGK
jgi:hypothetical protein